jgi:nucleotide-binding universal stress UspA family protein
MFTKILLAYDGSDGANRALELGIDLARTHQAELWALSVEETLPRFSGTIDEVQEEKEYQNRYYGQLLDAAMARARDAGIELKTLLRSGHAAKTIIDVAQEGKFDLVLVGHSGRSAVWAKFLGTTAEKVSRHASCSVLIVR